MKATKACYHVVYDREGRILALVPVALTVMSDGVQVGWRPVAGLNQFVTEVQLTAAQARVAPQELIDQFQVRFEHTQQNATLHRRRLRPAATGVSKARRSNASGPRA